MYCKKCGHEMVNGECGNCGYYVGEEENYYINRDKLKKFWQKITNLKMLNILMLIVALFMLDYIFEECLTAARYGHGIFLYLGTSGTLALIGRILFIVITAVVLFLYRKSVFQEEKISRSNYIIALILFITAVIYAFSSTKDIIDHSLIIKYSDIYSDYEIKIRNIEFVVEIIKAIFASGVYMLYFIGIKKKYKEQNIK